MQIPIDIFRFITNALQINSYGDGTRPSVVSASLTLLTYLLNYNNDTCMKPGTLYFDYIYVIAHKNPQLTTSIYNIPVHSVVEK